MTTIRGSEAILCLLSSLVSSQRCHYLPSISKEWALGEISLGLILRLETNIYHRGLWMSTEQLQRALVEIFSSITIHREMPHQPLITASRFNATPWTASQRPTKSHLPTIQITRSSRRRNETRHSKLSYRSHRLSINEGAHPSRYYSVASARKQINSRHLLPSAVWLRAGLDLRTPGRHNQRKEVILGHKLTQLPKAMWLKPISNQIACCSESDFKLINDSKTQWR